MPTTINELIKHFNLSESQKVKWGEKIPCEKEGVYIVSLSNDPNLNNGIKKEIPIDENILEKWINKVDGFELDNVKTKDKDKVIERFSQFWLPDENIIYIGKAPLRKDGEKGVGNRVHEFYKTEYGKSKPHAGGHWLKTLSVLNDSFVYYIFCCDSAEVELKLLQYFISHVSEKSRKILKENLSLPFGNLELEKGNRKKHGLGKMKK